MKQVAALALGLKPTDGAEAEPRARYIAALIVVDWLVRFMSVQPVTVIVVVLESTATHKIITSVD